MGSRFPSGSPNHLLSPYSLQSSDCWEKNSCLLAAAMIRAPERKLTTESNRQKQFSVFALRLGDLLGGQADGGDLIGKGDGPSQVQQSNVTVQIFLPVVFGMDDDFINGHNLLSATLKPGE